MSNKDYRMIVNEVNDAALKEPFFFQFSFFVLTIERRLVSCFFSIPSHVRAMNWEEPGNGRDLFYFILPVFM
jgi:hypothetical protein